MKPNPSTAFAMWLLEHVIPSPSRSALVGDLLEQLHHGSLLCTPSNSPRLVRRKRITGGGRPGAWKRVIPTVTLLLLACMQVHSQTEHAAGANFPAPKAQMVSVDKDVQLEVLDWGLRR